MKRKLTLLVILAMAFGLLAIACDDSDDEGGEGQACRGWVEPCDPACGADQYCDNGSCKDIVPCESECDSATEYCDVTNGECVAIPDDVSVEAEDPCDEGLVCEDGICVADETDGDADGDEPDGDEPDGDEPDGDEPDGDEPVCVDEECPGAELCNDADECEVLCVEDKFNQDCPGATEFATLAYGDCEDVPCVEDADCAGLEACDNPESGSTAAFICNDDSLCVRDVQ